MNKSIIALLVLIFAAGLTGISFAQAKTASTSYATKQAQVIKGKIISVDTANSQVTIKESSGVDKTVSVPASDMAALKTGEEIKVTLKSGSNMAAHVKIVSGHKKSRKSKQ